MRIEDAYRLQEPERGHLLALLRRHKNRQAALLLRPRAAGEPVEHLPEAYTINESVNGVVSLTKIRPSQILPADIAAVEAELRRHPRAHRYRLDAKQDRLTVYERTGPELEETLALVKLPIVPPRERINALRADMDRRARFTPVLRFILVDPARRTFRTERTCYLGSIDD